MDDDNKFANPKLENWVINKADEWRDHYEKTRQHVTELLKRIHFTSMHVFNELKPAPH